MIENEDCSKMGKRGGNWFVVGFAFRREPGGDVGATSEAEICAGGLLVDFDGVEGAGKAAAGLPHSTKRPASEGGRYKVKRKSSGIKPLLH